MQLSNAATAAFIRSNLPPDLQRIAAGVYSTTKEGTTYRYDDDLHPTKMWFTTTPSQRYSILGSSHIIAGILYVDSSGLVNVLSHPKITFNATGMSDNIVIGHHGDALHNIIPVSVNYTDITKNIVGFLPSKYKTSFGGIVDQQEATSHQVTEGNDGEENASQSTRRLPHIPTYDDQNVAHQALLPTAVPLFYNHGLDGPYDITDPNNFAVLQSRLADIHPILGEWLFSIHYSMTNYESHGLNDTDKFEDHEGLIMPTVPDELRPSLPTAVSTIANTNDIATDIIADLQKIAENNVIVWYNDNKDHHEDITNQLSIINGSNQGTGPPTNQQNGTPAPAPAPAPATASTMADKAAAQRIERNGTIWRLMLSSKDKEPTDGMSFLNLPTLSEPMKVAMADPKPINAVSAMVSSIKETINYHQGQSDHISSLTDFGTNIMNVAFVSGMLTAAFHDDDLDVCIPMLDKKLSVYNFLPPRTDSVVYEQIVEETNAVTYEALHGGVDANRTRPSSSLYIDGRQESLHDVLSTVANIVAIFKWVIATEDGSEPEPELIEDLRDIFKLLKDIKFKRYFERFESTWKWLGHSVLKDIQGLILARFQFAKTNAIITSVINGDDVSTEGLQCYNLYRNALIAKINTIIAGSNTIEYQVEPVTYQSFRPTPAKPAKKQKTGNGTTQQSTRNGTTGDQSSLQNRPGQENRPSNPDYGFLNPIVGRVSFPVLSNGQLLCGDYSTISRSCIYGRSCIRAHVNYPAMNGNQQDREIVERFVSNTPGVSFRQRQPDTQNRVSFASGTAQRPTYQQNQQYNNRNGTNNRRTTQPTPQGNPQNNTNQPTQG